jgi:hypothetical protein
LAYEREHSHSDVPEYNCSFIGQTYIDFEQQTNEFGFAYDGSYNYKGSSDILILMYQNIIVPSLVIITTIIGKTKFICLLFKIYVCLAYEGTIIFWYIRMRMSELPL